LLKQKVAPKVAIILGYFIFSKNHNEQKVANLVALVSGNTLKIINRQQQ
jgi:hypothetical protein